ncbi:hypothetical protein B0H11DRAFT_2268353 [Mycena galericulata]|nr:hypothetical protein B0H11DRAFT_2268353 [Mycena galericulata]
MNSSVPTSTMPESLDVRLMKEVGTLGIDHMDVDKALEYCKGLQEENWLPNIGEPLLRQKLMETINRLEVARHLTVGSELETTEPMQTKLIEAIIELGVVGVDLDKATQLVKNLEDENWFPHIQDHLLRQKLQTISELFEEQLGVQGV